MIKKQETKTIQVGEAAITISLLVEKEKDLLSFDECFEMHKQTKKAFANMLVNVYGECLGGVLQGFFGLNSKE